MRETRQRILKALRGKNLFTESLGQDALSVLRKTLAPDPFIQKVNEESKWEDCLHCNGQPYCSLFLAIAYLEKGLLLKARSEVEEAIVGFRMRGLNWNQAMCHWMLGTILLEESDHDSAERSLQKALEMLSPLIKEYRTESNGRQARECERHIREIEKTIKGISNSFTRKHAHESHYASERNPGSDHTEGPRVEDRAFLVVPWIPIYERVEVEEDVGEPRWVEPTFRQRSQLTEIYIDGTCYTIHPLRQSARYIALSADKRYGWVKVHSESMMEAQPTPIRAGDYVLFCESDWPDRNEIVIISRASTSSIANNVPYLIKRYSKGKQELVSETSLEPLRYNQENVFEDYRCMGVVIAVAKEKDECN